MWCTTLLSTTPCNCELVLSIWWEVPSEEPMREFYKCNYKWSTIFVSSLSLSLYLCYSSLIIWLVLIAELYMSPHHLLLELFKITDPSQGWQGNCVNTNFPTTIKLRLTILLNTHWLAGWHWLHSELLGGEPCLPWHQIMLVKCTLIMFVFLYWAAALDILFRENIKSRHLNFPQTIWY